MAYFLDCSRDTIYEYENNPSNRHNKKGFSDIIKKARDLCIANLEEAMYTQSKIGQIFIAKNYGYRDQQEIVSVNLNKDVSNLSDEELEERLTKLGQ